VRDTIASILATLATKIEGAHMPVEGDPLHGSHSIPAIPPVPPVPPVPHTEQAPAPTAPPVVTVTPVQPRHATDERLVSPGEKPVDLGMARAGPTAPALAMQIKAVDNRHRLSAALLAAGITAVLLLVLLVAYLVHGQQTKVADLDARTLHADVQTAQLAAQQQVFLCRQATFLLGLSVTSTRANWPRGPLDYDVTLAAVKQSAVDALCPGI
jgi:hypothetical protein